MHRAILKELVTVKFWRSCIAAFFSIILLRSDEAIGSPRLLSVTPMDGATQVATASPLVFVFDQAMDTNVLLLQSVTGFTGSYELTAPGLNHGVGTLWTDDRTLTMTPAFPFPYETFTWKLNPAGSLSFLRLKSKAGVELPPVSGTFTTGVPAANPQLTSSVPPNNESGVRSSTVRFRFSTSMRKDPAIAGNPPSVPAAVSWSGAGLEPTNFVYTWSIDGRILYCDYRTNFPKNTVITWILNPAAAPTKLQSDTGLALPADTYTGRFTTGATDLNCDPPFPPNWGSYSISKSFGFVQTSDADPVPDDREYARSFSASVYAGSTSGGSVTAASFTAPAGNAVTLLNLFGNFIFSDTAPDQSSLDAMYPAGAYVLRFTRSADPERTITMTMPENAPPIPKIINFLAAQSINAGTDFILQWNGFAGADADDYISLFISDTNGFVFDAPDFCGQRPLPVTATSIVIPANTLGSNRTYNALILYGAKFYFSTNAIPQMQGFGYIVRNLRFTVSTVTSGGTTNPPAAPTISDVRLLPNGNPEFEVTGTVAATYRIERTGSLTNPSWQTVGTVIVTPVGSMRFEDTQNPKTLPLFYRAVAN
jgi:hypothetical protein